MTGIRKLLARFVRPGAGPVARVVVGLIALSICVALLADIVFNLFRNDEQVAREIRKRVSENVAIQLAVLAQGGDRIAIEKTVATIINREADIVSIGLRQEAGELIYASPGHLTSWQALGGGKSTLTHVEVPLFSGGKQRWGQIEISFRPVGATGWRYWFERPAVLMVLTLVIVGGIGFFVYMRRVLTHLDPTAAIPERVKLALDTLVEGVLILDVSGRVLLANRAFLSMAPAGERNLVGRKASDLAWLVAELGADRMLHPWHRVARSHEAVTGQVIDLARGSDGATRVVVNASPVLDAKNAVRGVIVSVNDVSALDQANAELRKALTDLRESQVALEARNEELKRLSEIDPLTSCLNRRAFMHQAGNEFARAVGAGTPLACIMTDIDKFKNVNDTYGHSVGDEVIQQTARILKLGLRPTDLLCRYGGEEFCFVLPGLDLAQAAVIAERLREKIQSQAGPGVRGIPNLKVTASFGVSSIEVGATTLAQLIEEADQALYAAKQAGRNIVSTFTDTPWLDASTEASNPKGGTQGVAAAIDEIFDPTR
ncbi:MAG: GGDEF domain-containing protein [Burkholderiales bacterium]|nr:GGDEF domain-containing protein [Burkholderiales bacterium]